MKDNLLFIIMFLIVAVIIISNSDWNNKTVVYDCSLAEISPDYPQEVKTECRRLRMEEYRERLINERKITNI